MLTLADSRHLGDATVYRDVAWTGTGRSLTSTFYVLLDAPRLAVAEDGGPAYAFFCYRGATPPAAGGLLTATVTAGPLASEQDQLVKQVRAAYGLADDAPVTLAPAPLDAGTVSLRLAGESGAAGDAFTSAVLGGGPARQTGTDATTFAVDLTAEGAALVLQALDDGLALLHAEWDLQVPYVLDDVALRVWCDVAAACRTSAELHDAGALGPAELTAALTSRHVAGTTRTTARPLTPEEDAALDALATGLLGSLLPATLLDASGAPVPYSSALEGELNLTLTATYPATRALSLTGDLPLPGGPAVRSDRVSTFDLAADQLLARVQVTAAGDLTARGIASVSVRLDYAGTTPAGAEVRRTGEALLRPASPTAVLAFDLATPSQRTVSPHLEVHFTDGSAPYALDLPPTDAELLELDVDRLGVLVVDVALGRVDPGLGASAVVELAYGPDSRYDTTLVLTGRAPTARWTAAVREPPGPYRRRVTWVVGEDRVTSDWTEATERSVVLDAPLTLAPPAAEVTFLSAGDFQGVQQLLVEVRTDASGPVSVLTFGAAGQSATWKGPSPLAYQVRETVVLSTGSHVVGAWRDDDRPVQVVRDALRLDVSVVGRLLDLGGSVRRAVVELQGTDPDAPAVTAVLDRPTDEPTCALRMSGPDDRSYRYRLTLQPPQGSPRSTDWLPGTSSILVLRPPS